MVGKAVALICLYTGIEAVYGSVMSCRARELLEQKAVRAEWDYLVENILSDGEPTICPYERLAADISDPSEAYTKLKALQDSKTARMKE